MRHITDKELFDTDKSCLVQTMLSLSQNDQKKFSHWSIAFVSEKKNYLGVL